MDRRPLVALALAALLVLAGCTGGGGGGAGEQSREASLAADGGATSTAAPEATPKSSGGTAGGDTAGGWTSAAALQNRKLIRTAEVTLEVDDFEATKANLTARVRDAGGYVGSVSQHTEEYGNETVTRGQVVLRVPVGNYSSVLAAVKSEGDLLRFTSDTQDVTGKVVDLQARLKNLRAERERLRELYEQANDTEAILAVQERLSEVQGEIERIEGRLKSLRNRVAYATVTVEIREERPEREPPEEHHWYDTGLIAAFLQSVDGVVVLFRATAVGLAYALPYLIVLSVPAVGVGLAVRHRDRFV